MRVGRSALDQDAIRLLEEYNPEVDFDWTRILKAPPELGVEPQPPPRASRRPEGPPQRAVAPPRAAAVNGDSAIVNGDFAAAEPVLAPEALDEPDVVPYVEPPAPTAASARLGAEGLQRLRGRYADLMNRIAQRVSDAAQQEELKSRAERLNPDTWVTDAEVSAGLDAYEATFEEIRAVVGRPRKRRRRRRGAGRDMADASAPSGAEGLAAEAEPPDTNADEDEPGD